MLRASSGAGIRVGTAAQQSLKVDTIADSLIREKVITPEQLSQAVSVQKSQGGRLGFHLINLGMIDELVLLRHEAKRYKVPAVDLNKSVIDEALLKLIPANVARKHNIIPLRKEGRKMYVAMLDPSNLQAIEDVEFRCRADVVPVIAGEQSLNATLDKLYPTGAVVEEAQTQTIDSLLSDITLEEEEVEMVEDEQDDMSAAALSVAVNDAPVIKLINAIMIDAVNKGASDIHFECFEHELKVRYRIDGTLKEIMKPPFKLKPALISRFKIMANMNIAERRVPQDGRIKLKIGKKVIDFRVSTLPTLFGEKVVLRILDKGSLPLNLDHFGIEPNARDEIIEGIEKPFGMVLVTGPTGSGKTTTLYSALSRVNKGEVNILTAEDPVEYNLLGINQVQIRPDIGLTFAAALRSFLRQDPNIIMVGEVRDLETGGIAIKAALTGHLVLSTLHTNSAPETLTRLLDMGLEAFNVASALNLVVAQRLVRKICDGCRVRYLPKDIELSVAKVNVSTKLRDLRLHQHTLRALSEHTTPEAAPFLHALNPDTTIGELAFFKGAGCEACAGSGFKGRQGLYEVMPITPTIKKLIVSNATVAEITDAAVATGMLTLRMDGWLKVIKGLTTIEQITRETSI